MLKQWSYGESHSLPRITGWHSAPSGKPVIHFLHGNGFCCRAYEPLLSLLSKDFDLWLCDVQGHGDSDKGSDFLGWNANAELALKAFSHQREIFGSAPVYAVGHSFGGVLTSLMLARHPSVFQKAVLLDPVWFPPNILAFLAIANALGLGALTPFARSASRRTEYWKTRDDAHDDLRRRGTYRHWRTEALQAYINFGLRDDPDGGVSLKCDRKLEARIYHTKPRQLWHAIRSIRSPTFVVQGASTMPFVRKAIDLAVRINDVISSRTVCGGHCFMQEHPETAAKSISEFLLTSGHP